jgi:hypothetical protein
MTTQQTLAKYNDHDLHDYYDRFFRYDKPEMLSSVELVQSILKFTIPHLPDSRWKLMNFRIQKWGKKALVFKNQEPFFWVEIIDHGGVYEVDFMKAPTYENTSLRRSYGYFPDNLMEFFPEGIDFKG